MAKIKISKELILTIVKQDNSKFVKKTTKLVNHLLSLSIDELSSKVSYINTKNVILQPVNELLNGSVLDNSKYIYFLGIENAQLEINTIKKINFWKHLKERFKYAWASRKLFKKRRRRRRRKVVDENENLNKLQFDPSKYNMYNLAEDMQSSMIKYLSETSLIELKDSRLIIRGRDDFGSTVEIVIYLVSLSNEMFKFHLPNKKGYIEIDINNRLNILRAKIEEAGDDFITILKILNTLYFNVNGHMANQVYMESVLNFVPSELFHGNDIYKVFLKVVNYIRIKSLRNIKSINNPNKLISEDVVCGQCGIEFMKMLNLI